MRINPHNHVGPWERKEGQNQRWNDSKADISDRLDDAKLLTFRMESVSMNKQPPEGENLSSLSCIFRRNTSCQPILNFWPTKGSKLSQVLCWWELNKATTGIQCCPKGNSIHFRGLLQWFQGAIEVECLSYKNKPQPKPSVSVGSYADASGNSELKTSTDRRYTLQAKAGRRKENELWWSREGRHHIKAKEGGQVCCHF